MDKPSSLKRLLPVLVALAGFPLAAAAGEADIKIPDLTQVTFAGLGGVSGIMLMYLGIVICAIGAVFGLVPPIFPPSGCLF